MDYSLAALKLLCFQLKDTRKRRRRTPQLSAASSSNTPGMYVMVVGGYSARAGEPPMIVVHKIVDLSPFPDREALWYLEVMEAYKLFYSPMIGELV
ncbi:hypothetical protein CJ030_MR8G018160 [Morella rubra]|uniref:Uncharacterized protein n=1 Tax=Morella rubra TaxID=262757 RepID=A0A6A1UQJ6_9ROSI|nr:hypothetical protein CJ030_MR8G018160 [Morella rubra]